MSAVTFDAIGWNPEDAATGDPRVPEACSWCRGGRVLLEAVELGRAGQLIPVQCRGCGGTGKVYINRRGTT